MVIPRVQIADLRPLIRDHSTDLAGRDGPGVPRPNRHHDAIDERARFGLAADATVEGPDPQEEANRHWLDRADLETPFRFLSAPQSA